MDDYVPDEMQLQLIFSKMIGNCIRRRVSVPSREQLMRCHEVAKADNYNCPVCKVRMYFLDPGAPHSCRLSLQHEASGEYSFMCCNCNLYSQVKTPKIR